MDDLHPLDQDDSAVTPALGAVVEQGRGSLPFALIHGESLVACAAWALGDAGVTAVDLGTEWAALVDAEEPFVLHDPLCPMTPAAFIAACVDRAVELDRVVVAVQPAPGEGVTTSVASPIVLPASVVAALDALPEVDFTRLAEALATRFRIERVPAPVQAARVRSPEDVDALEALTKPT